MERMLKEDQKLRDMEVVRRAMRCRNDLSEVYSVPRVAQMASELGMTQGFSLDFSRPTESGYVWNVWKRACRERALAFLVLCKEGEGKCSLPQPRAATQ